MFDRDIVVIRLFLEKSFAPQHHSSVSDGFFGEMDIDNDSDMNTFKDGWFVSYDMWSIASNPPDMSTIGSSPPVASFSSDCVSLRTLDTNSSGDRRSSTISPTTSIWSEDLVTSPVTPERSRWSSMMPLSVVPTSMTSGYCPSEESMHDYRAEEESLWMSREWQLPLLPSSYQKPAARYTGIDVMNGHGSLLPLDAHANDPALSRQIFADSVYSPVCHSSYTYPVDRSMAQQWSIPQTIAPKTTIQPVLLSSPSNRIISSSPPRVESIERLDFGLDSSPLPIPSPHAIASRCNADIPAYKENVVVDTQPLRIRKLPERGARRHYQRKTLTPAACKPRKAVNTTRCDVVIPQNTFACKFAGCIDKSTNRQKCFKRQEHRKRHEVTVHEGKKLHFCWVPGCSTGFTRTDNLKHHIKSTHGKNNPAQRNRYVATLDPTSEHYDPEWEGELTDDGYPMLSKSMVHRCWVSQCEKSYHLEEKLRTHLLQQHGRKLPDGEATDSSAHDDGGCDDGTEVEIDVGCKGE